MDCWAFGIEVRDEKLSTVIVNKPGDLRKKKSKGLNLSFNLPKPRTDPIHQTACSKPLTYRNSINQSLFMDQKSLLSDRCITEIEFYEGSRYMHTKNINASVKVLKPFLPGIPLRTDRDLKGCDEPIKLKSCATVQMTSWNPKRTNLPRDDELVRMVDSINLRKTKEKDHSKHPGEMVPHSRELLETMKNATPYKLA